MFNSLEDFRKELYGDQPATLFEKDLIPRPSEEERGFLAETVSALGAGAISTLGAISGTAEMVGIPGGKTAREYWEEIGQRESLGRPEYLQEGTIWEHPERLADWRWWARSVGENLPNMAAMMLPGLGAMKAAKLLGWGAKAIKTVALAAGWSGAFTVEAGFAYNQAKEEMAGQGYSDQEIEQTATMEGLTVGVINGILEILPFKALFLDKVGAPRIIRRIIRQAWIEGTTETAQEAVNIYVEKLGHKPDQTLSDNIGRLLESGIIGAALGGGAGLTLGRYGIEEEGVREPVESLKVEQEVPFGESGSPENVELIKDIGEEPAVKEQEAEREEASRKEEVRTRGQDLLNLAEEEAALITDDIAKVSALEAAEEVPETEEEVTPAEILEEEITPAEITREKVIEPAEEAFEEPPEALAREENKRFMDVMDRRLEEIAPEDPEEREKLRKEFFKERLAPWWAATPYEEKVNELDAFVEKREKPPKKKPKEPAKPEAKPTAAFLGWQETAEGDHVALYNIVSGPKEGTSVTVEGLEREGIAIPETPEKPEIKPPVKEKVEEKKPPEAEIIPHSKDLDIRNIEGLPRGTGARYLEVIKGEKDEYIAKQWRRKPTKKGILIDFEAEAKKKLSAAVATITGKKPSFISKETRGKAREAETKARQKRLRSAASQKHLVPWIAMSGGVWDVELAGEIDDIIYTQDAIGRKKPRKGLMRGFKSRKTGRTLDVLVRDAREAGFDIRDTDNLIELIEKDLNAASKGDIKGRVTKVTTEPTTEDEFIEGIIENERENLRQKGYSEERIRGLEESLADEETLPADERVEANYQDLKLFFEQEGKKARKLPEEVATQETLIKKEAPFELKPTEAPLKLKGAERVTIDTRRGTPVKTPDGKEGTINATALKHSWVKVPLLEKGVAYGLKEYPNEQLTIIKKAVIPTEKIPVATKGEQVSLLPKEKGEQISLEEAIETKLQLEAFHGTPYDFERFTTEAIGKGEGAQAFGWGLYFTNKEDIARFYADQLAKRALVYDGEQLSKDQFIDKIVSQYGEDSRELANRIDHMFGSGYLGDQIVSIISKMNKEQGKIAEEITKGLQRVSVDIGWNITPTGGIRVEDRMSKRDQSLLFDIQGRISWYRKNVDALSEVKDNLRATVKAQEKNIIGFKETDNKADEDRATQIRDDAARMLEMFDEYNLVAKYLEPKRHLYRVTLHKGKSPSEYNYLDWHKPISEEQFQKIQDQIDEEYKAGEMHKNDLISALNSAHEHKHGADSLYKRFADILESEKEASLLLLRAGIDGIKYKAGTLSGIESKAYNYVVFDESAISIEELTKFAMEPALAAEPRGYEFTKQQQRDVNLIEMVYFPRWLEKSSFKDLASELRLKVKPYIDLAEFDPKQVAGALTRWEKEGVTAGKILGAATVEGMETKITLALNGRKLKQLEHTTYHELYERFRNEMVSAKDRTRLDKDPYFKTIESEADAFAEYNVNAAAIKDAPNFIKRIFLKLKRLLTIIRNGLNARGFYRPEDIWGKMRLGVGPPRKRGRPAAGIAFEQKPAQEGLLVDAEKSPVFFALGKEPTPKKRALGVATITGAAREKIETKNRFVKHFKEFWKPFSTLPEGEKALVARYKAMGDVARAMRFIEGIHAKLDTYPDDVKQDIFRFLDGQVTSDILPGEAGKVAESLKERTLTIGKMLLKRGILKQEQFDKYKGRYIHYMYARHILGDEGSIGLTSSGKLNLSYTRKRNPNLTMDQRKQLGLIEDASVAVPVGMGKALTDIAKYDYMTKIAENAEWVWQPSLVEVVDKEDKKVTMGIGKLIEEVDIYERMVKESPSPETRERYNILKDALDKAVEETENVPEDFVQVATTKTYGPLAGAFIRKPIADDIKPLVDALAKDRGKIFNTLMSIETQGMALFKMGKVALNLPTAFRNVISNILQNNMRGRALMSIPGDIVNGCKSMLEKDQYYEEAFRHGIFKTNWFVTEVNDVLDEFQKAQKGGYAAFLNAVKGVAKYYGKIDDISKHSIFVQLRKEGRPVDEALLEAMKWGMDYSLASRSVKTLRKHLIPFACVDDKTEILTKRGWLTYNQVEKGDLALSLNMGTEKSNWEEITGIFKADYGGNEMLHFRDRHLDMMLTPDHRVVTYSKIQKDRERSLRLDIRLAYKLGASDHIPVAAQHVGFPRFANHSDAFVKIIGWIVTEGHFKRTCDQVCISQNEGAKADEIARLLKWQFPKQYYTQKVREKEIVFHIYAKVGRYIKHLIPNKQLTPEFLLSLPKRQLKLLVETMIDGDGSRNRTKKGSWQFIQKPNETLNMFQMALCLLGISHGYYTSRQSTHSIGKRKGKYYNLKRTRPKKVKYDGMVWCPYIPKTGTWFARRNGKVFITHNTFQYKIAPLILESLRKRPWVVGKFAIAIPMLVKMMAKEYNDMDDDDWKEIENQLPTYVKKSGSMMILPWKTPKEQWQFLNLEYFFPWGNYLNIFRDIKEKDMGEVYRGMGISNPFMDIARMAASAREDQPPQHPFYGTPIYNRLDSPAKKVAKLTDFLAFTWLPGMMSRKGALGYSIMAATGREDRWGRTVTPAQAIGRWFGANILSVSPELSMAIASVKMQDLRKELYRVLKDPSKSEAAKEAAEQTYREKVADLAEASPGAILPITKAKGEDKVFEELNDLLRKGALTMGPPSKIFHFGGKKIEMDLEQYRKYLDDSSAIARRKLGVIISSPGWVRWSDERKTTRIRLIVKNARKRARGRIKRMVLRQKYRELTAKEATKSPGPKEEG